MDKESTLKIKSERLASAFNHLRTENKELTWEKIISILKGEGDKVKFGCSKANLQGYFGIGGLTRSRLLKGPSYKLIPIQLFIIECVNRNQKLNIKYTGGEPDIDEHGHFATRKRREHSVVQSPDMDTYRLYYWRNDQTAGQANLVIYKLGSKRATLEISYPHADPVLLEGTYRQLTGIFTASFHDAKDPDGKPLTQVSWICNPGSSKHCYFGTFSSCHRGVPLSPVAGMVMLFKQEYLETLNAMFPVEELAHFFLHRKRYKTENSGLNFLAGGGVETKTRNAPVNAFFEARKFAGVYKGFFVNPKNRTFETCILKIKKTGDIEWLVDANMDAAVFTGIARLYSKKKDLIISYDYIKDIADYRMKLIFDVAQYRFAKDAMLFGLMNGLELRGEELMTSSMAMYKIDDGEKDITSFKPEIMVLFLDRKDDYDRFVEILEKYGLREFFFGEMKQDFLSLSVLQKIKNKHAAPV